MSMTLPEDDEETATAGSVKGFSNILHFPRDTPLQSSLPKIIEGCNQCIPLFVESLPVRFTSAHFCYSNPAMRVPISIIQQGLGKRTRIRMRVHYGTPLEIRYAMLPFGIRCPPNVNRIQEESDTTKQKHTWDMDQCVERRREMEQRREAIERDREMKSGILLYPRHPKDVLIGRGQSYKEHPGNQYYQALIESKLDQYIAAPGNFEKTCISMEVVQTVQDEGGRFLALVEGKGWKILENLVARDKTSNSFRSKNTCNRNAARK